MTKVKGHAKMSHQVTIIADFQYPLIDFISQAIDTLTNTNLQIFSTEITYKIALVLLVIDVRCLNKKSFVLET